jgi:hypothetical protein
MLNKKNSLQFDVTLVPCFIVGFSITVVTGPCLLDQMFVLGEQGFCFNHMTAELYQ